MSMFLEKQSQMLEMQLEMQRMAMVVWQYVHT